MKYIAYTATKAELDAFIKVQRSGETNMLDRDAVLALSNGIVHEQAHTSIISDYAELKKLYAI